MTSGAASDIEQATRLARLMVTRWGLSDELGTVAYGENQEEVFLGHSVSRRRTSPRRRHRRSTREIRRLVEEGLAEARQILTENRDQLERLAQGLLEYETLTGDEIKGLLIGRRPVRDSADDSPSAKTSAVPSTKGRPKGASEPDAGLEPQPQA